jgi:hypothetical protein
MTPENTVVRASLLREREHTPDAGERDSVTDTVTCRFLFQAPPRSARPTAGVAHLADGVMHTTSARG